MKANQILLEYDQALTVKNYGDRIWNAILNFPIWAFTTVGISNPIFGIRTLLRSTRPEDFQRRWPITPYEYNGKDYITKDDSEGFIQQFKQTMILDVINSIKDFDPTPNKKYTPWLIRSWLNSSGRTKIEDLNRFNALRAYDVAKTRRMIKPQHADIGVFKTYEDFEDTMMSEYKISEILKSTKKLSRGTKKEYDFPDARVIVPLDEEAACYYGQGTRWCTAATEGNNYFQHYNRQGPLYIILPKQPKYDGEKYQVHTPSGQFMNELDDQVNPKEILKNRFPAAGEFIIKNNPDLLELVTFENPETVVEVWKAFFDIIKDHVMEMISQWEIDDDYYYDYIQKNYSDSDGEIDWDRAYAAGDSYLDHNDSARALLGDIESLHNLGYNSIMEVVDEVTQGDDGPALMDHMDNIITQALMDNNYGELGDWVNANVGIYDKDANLAGGRKIVSEKIVGPWRIVLFQKRKLGRKQ